MAYCQYAKSEMTPCVRRDGDIAWAIGLGDRPICAGCERGPIGAGVKAPEDWAKQVADYKAKSARGVLRK